MGETDSLSQPARRVLVAAARVFAEEVTDIAAAAGVEVVGWIETFDQQLVEPAGDPPMAWLDDQAGLEPDLPVIVAIVKPEVRRGAFERLLGAGRRLAPAILHPSAILGRSTQIEEGCVIFPNVSVGTRSRIGAGTIVNRSASIGHHTTVGRYCFVGPSAAVAGQVTVGDYATIALNAAIRDERSVGEAAYVGAGAAVVADVPAGTTVVGVPARPLPRREDA